jgi:hypothetical protein
VAGPDKADDLQRLRLVALVLVVVVAVASVPVAPASELSADPVGLKAAVTEFTPDLMTEASWPVVDAKGRSSGDATWRMVRGTGNCCENYVAADRSGRLFDFGGGYLRYTDDLGQTWKQVQPLGDLCVQPTCAGEGAVAVAPGGDVVGMTWDFYTADRIVAYKYEAESGQWYYLDQKLYPFFDRPWISVVRGPFTVGGVTVPYVTILVSNLTMNRGIWYYSLDGLTYFAANDAALSADGEVEDWLPAKGDPEADYIQPHSRSGTVPLSQGGAVAKLTPWEPSAPWMTMVPPDLRWATYVLKGKEPLGGPPLVQDSKGYLHSIALEEGKRRIVRHVTYRISRDGGRSWEGKRFGMPQGLTSYVDHIADFKAHGDLGASALALETRQDQSLLFGFAFGARGAPRLERIHFLGDKEPAFRLDFSSVAILSDGTLVTSFRDSSLSAWEQPQPNFNEEISTIAFLLDAANKK